jgi:hypothetical protein
MLYMVIESFRGGDPVPVYRRFRDQGRMMPDGLRYVSSWVETSYGRCFQLMECDDPRLFEEWFSHWSDLVDFELIPVVPSAEAAREILARF